MNSQTNIRFLKKVLKIALAFLLIWFSVGPIPVGSAATNDKFPGTVTSPENVYTVDMDGDKLYHITLLNYIGERIERLENTNKYSFGKLTFGSYTIRAELAESPKQSFEYTFEIKPNAPKLKYTEDNKSRDLTIFDGLAGATPLLLNTSIQPSKEFSGVYDESLQAFFRDLPAGYYQASQEINGARSTLSDGNTIVITPEILPPPTVKSSGSDNKSGSIEFKSLRKGNTIFLYLNEREEQKCVVSTTNTCTFTNLKSGSYQVFQMENDLKSESIGVTVDNGEEPKITYDTTDGLPDLEIVYPNNYNTSLVKAIGSDNNIITPSFSGLPALKDGKPIPGNYIVTISATGSNGISVSKMQKVTIVPPTIKNVTKKDTDDSGGGAYGTIIILKNGGIYPGSTLFIMDTQGNTVKTIPTTSEMTTDSDFIISKVPTGDGYTIVQAFGGVKSTPSEPIDVKDNTKPIITINGGSTIELIAGQKYIEYGALATDNVTPSNDLKIIINNDSVNTSIPGRYEVTYTTVDLAGNIAEPKTRVVLVKPSPVLATGSTADIGEIGVTNVFPGTPNNKTILTIYKYDKESNSYKRLDGEEYTISITNSETTAVFRNLKPGLYYVLQTVNQQSSKESNVVEIIDIDKPYITMTGSDHYSFVWSQAQSPYFTSSNEFTDPGVTAKDYIDGDLSPEVKKEIQPEEENLNPNLQKVTFPAPGKYVFTYNVSASRGVKAEEKIRTVTVAPNSPTAVSTIGHNEITVNNLFIKRAQDNVSVTLYDPYGVALTTTPLTTASSSATFSDVKAGLGYTVTQTVNGIESTHSSPVDISIHLEAGSNIHFSTFKLAGISVTPVIDHTAGTIKFTVPVTTNLAALTPVFTIESDKVADPIVKVGNAKQTSNSSEQDFTSPVVYKLLDNTTILKSYTVSVVKSANASVFWKDTVLLNTNLTSSSQSLELTSSQKATASKNGVSYLSNNQIIHMSALSVSMNNDARLTARKLNASQVLRTGDPSWAASLSEVMEIKSTSSSKFAQPLEIEQTSSSDKVLAKLLRENGKLYAIQMPSKTLKGKTIGLVPEPGLYALVSPATPPVFLNSGDGKYKLISGFGGVIHYTDSSKSIQFIRSSNSNELGANLSKESPTTLNSWKQYLPGTEVSSENGELFAFSMKDQFISPIRSMEAAPPSEWKPTIQRVEANKIWHVTFNARIDLESLRNNPIRVTDSGGYPVAVNSVISNHGRTVDIVPIVPYDRGEIYTLWVDKELKGNTIKKEYLKKAVKLTFQIK